MKILHFKRKCNPTDTVIPVKPAALGFSASVSKSAPARLARVHVYLWVFNVCQIFSCLEVQTDEVSALISPGVEPSPHPHRLVN